MSHMNIRFSEPVSPEASRRSDQSSSAPLPCDEKASDLFMKKMEERDSGRHDLESGGTKDDDAELPREAAAPFPAMTNPLENLFSGRMEQISATSAPAEMENADLERLVERILVSTPERGGHEVRLSLGNHILPGTEIVLQRDMDGMLSVTLTSTNASSFQTLVSSQGSLKGMLEKLENSEVRVDVKQGTDREENDSHRRSRGYMAEDMFTP